MRKSSSGFGRDDVEILDEQLSYDGFLKIRSFQLRHRLFEGGWGAPINRELVDKSAAAGVLLVDPEREQVVLIEQFRIGVQRPDHSPWILELVAGMVEPGEQPADVAHRESEEEAGASIRELTPIGEYYSTPGGTNEYLHLFVGAVDCSGLGGVHGLEEEGEDIRVHIVSVERAQQMLDEGTICNAHTALALYWLRGNYAEWRARALA